MKVIRATDIWAKAGVYYVRTEAMVFGFDVRLEGEFESDTPDSEYILVMEDDGKPLSTCRIHAVPEEGYAKIERVATVSTARNRGAGRLAIEEAEKWILEKGIHKIIITSRDEAVGFYEKLGYTADYSKDCRALFPPDPKKEKEKQERAEREGDAAQQKPRFQIVYVEKEL